MTIHIEELKFQTIIGILEFERETPQDVIINLSLEYAYDGEFINYATVAAMIQKSFHTSQFLLLEDALESISTELSTAFPKINTLFLKITKPSILPECIVSVSHTFYFNS